MPISVPPPMPPSSLEILLLCVDPGSRLPQLLPTTHFSLSFYHLHSVSLPVDSQNHSLSGTSQPTHLAWNQRPHKCHTFWDPEGTTATKEQNSHQMSTPGIILNTMTLYAQFPEQKHAHIQPKRSLQKPAMLLQEALGLGIQLKHKTRASRHQL